MSDVMDKPFEEQFSWRTIASAKVWRPRPGESVAGHYRGLAQRTGQWGDYQVVVLDSPEHGLLTVSGSVLISTLVVNNIEEGDPIKITFVKKEPIANTDRFWKRYKVEVAE